MDLDIATQPKYRELEEFTKPELKAMADRLELKLPPAMGIPKMAQAIRTRQARLALDAQQEAFEQKRADSGDTNRKPSFEEILMDGGEFLGKKYEPSPRYLYRFLNELDRGDEASFTKGGRLIRLFEKDKNGKDVQVVMPQCFCETVESPGPDATKLEKLEFELRKAVSLVTEGVPVYANRPDPQTGRMKSTIVSFTKRYSFIPVGPAPKDAPLGLYLPNPE